MAPYKLQGHSIEIYCPVFCPVDWHLVITVAEILLTVYEFPPIQFASPG
jgi:hypothetical protein